jgi:F-type H+-transporting ATPase subunit a
MHLSPDQVVLWQNGVVKLNSTIVTTWGVMLILTIGSWLVTRKLSTGVKISRWQNLLEIIVGGVKEQIQEVGIDEPEKYLAFIGTLFLFIAVSNLCTLFPFYEPPTGSLSTTAALAISVFAAVPVFGVLESGVRGYLRTYLEPTWLMLPFNIISELTRTLALAVRLFGNIMSGSMIVAILLSITPLIFPIFMTLLGLLTGMVQAYIFSILATVYIAAATETHDERPRTPDFAPSSKLREATSGEPKTP